MSNEWEEWLKEEYGDDRDFLPTDMGAVLDGDLTAPEPRYLRRSDGHHLLYPAHVHWIAGEPESGKSWIALLATAELLNAGRKVVYLDWEMNPQEMARRLLALGVPDLAIREHLQYVRPPGKMTEEWLHYYGKSEEHAPALFEDAALVVFDACTEAMVTDELEPLSNTDVAKWVERAPRLARLNGAAVVVIDHVVKDWEARSRYAIGAQHKLAHTDVHLSLYGIEPFAPGMVGRANITVQKDRPGRIREHAVKGKQAGTLVLNAENPEMLDGFVAAPTPEDRRPTHRMDEILKVARRSPEPLSKNQLESVGGSRSRTPTTREAVTLLIAEGRLVPFPEDVERGRAHPRYVAAEPDGDGTP